MLKNVADIHIASFDKLFKEHKVTKEDLIKYQKLLSQGKDLAVIDHFVENYMLPPIDKYYKHLNIYLLQAEKGELKEKSKSNLIKMIPLLTFGLVSLINNNFKKFIEKAVGYNIFNVRGINKKKVKDAILDSTLGQFQSLTSEALSGTQIKILKNIRNMQREMVFFNQTTRGLSGKDLDIKTQSFLKSVERMFPEYQKLKEGKVITSRAFGVNNTVRQYKLQPYLEMAVRTTLLNIDRTAVQIAVLNDEAEIAKREGRFAVNVVEYAKIDNRPLKTGIDRVICKEVLSDRKYGRPLLALDGVTADILGIRTVDEIRSTPDYAMGPWCRHGLLPVSAGMRKDLEKEIQTYYGVQ